MGLWKCTVCGYIHEGAEAPDRCPVCMASSDKFVPHQAGSADLVKQWRCTVCGYVHEGPEPPDKCPVCRADRDKFVLNLVEKPKAASAGKWRCIVCGYIHDGDGPPERCPVCKAVRDKFVPHSAGDLENKVSVNIFEEMGTAVEAPKRVNHLKTPEISLDTYYLLPGQVLDYHKHPTGDQIFMVNQGTGDLYIDDGAEKVVRLSPGTAVLTLKDMWHKIVNSGKNILIVSQTTKQPSGIVLRK